MNHHETNDWRTIAHEEYENRKSLEVQLARATAELNTLQQTLQNSNNYNNILTQKIAALEAAFTVQREKLTRSIELLKNAKILYAKRKEHLAVAAAENQALLIEKNKLHNELLQKTAQLDAEMQQHEKTNYKLAQTLSKLAAATAATLNTNNLLNSGNVIYAESYQEEKVVDAAEDSRAITKKRGMFSKIFSLAEEEVDNDNRVTHSEEHDEAEFIDQLLRFEKQLNK